MLPVDMYVFTLFLTHFKQSSKLEGDLLDRLWIRFPIGLQNALNPRGEGHDTGHISWQTCVASYKSGPHSSFGHFCHKVPDLESIFGRTARWRSLVAGAVAGPSLLITGRKTRHTSMAIYILLRAAVLAARCGMKNERAGSLCRPLSWKHGDTFLMCLSSSQIL
jgi:hypothetical protein